MYKDLAIHFANSFRLDPQKFHLQNVDGESQGTDYCRVHQEQLPNNFWVAEIEQYVNNGQNWKSIKLIFRRSKIWDSIKLINNIFEEYGIEPLTEEDFREGKKFDHSNELFLVLVGEVSRDFLNIELAERNQKQG